MCVNGSAQSAGSLMTGISTPLRIFWPRGSRCRPVEGVSDQLGDQLKLATPNEAGKLIREDEKPPTLVVGRCHKRMHHSQGFSGVRRRKNLQSRDNLSTS